jgi:hypothetical protein
MSFSSSPLIKSCQLGLVMQQRILYKLRENRRCGRGTPVAHEFIDIEPACIATNRNTFGALSLE